MSDEPETEVKKTRKKPFRGRPIKKVKKKKAAKKKRKSRKKVKPPKLEGTAWQTQLTDAEREILNWYRGSLRHLTRPHAQRRLYDGVHEALGLRRKGGLTLCVLNCHRRLGKTYLEILLGLERCLKRPHQQVKFGAPSRDQARDIVKPLIEQILRNCPDELIPVRSGPEYRFENPLWREPGAYSTFRLVGCNIDDGNRLRGQAADLVVLDEVREMPNLEYIVTHVLAHQFQGREDPLLVMTTTPPKSMAHDFVTRFVPKAQDLGTYWCVPSASNDDCTAEDEALVLQMCGSRKSIAWRREMGCELISDPENLIVPEFQEKKDSILVPHHPRPTWYQPYTIIDGAYQRDQLAIGYVWVDFRNQLVVFEDTEVGREKTLHQIRSDVIRREHELFKDVFNLGKSPRRYGDFTALELETLSRDFKLQIQPAEKWDKQAGLAGFRHLVQSARIRIVTAPDKYGRPTRNVALIRQLEHGVYNRTRTDFARSEEMGHWDAGMMAVYASRMVNLKSNPDATPPFTDERYHFVPQDVGPGGKRLPRIGQRNFAQLKQAFGVRD